MYISSNNIYLYFILISIKLTFAFYFIYYIFTIIHTFQIEDKNIIKIENFSSVQTSPKFIIYFFIWFKMIILMIFINFIKKIIMRTNYHIFTLIIKI